MLVLELQRRKQGKTQAELSAIAKVDQSYISRGERYGVMYDGHLKRLANALEWRGEPRDLLMEVK